MREGDLKVAGTAKQRSNLLVKRWKPFEESGQLLNNLCRKNINRRRLPNMLVAAFLKNTKGALSLHSVSLTGKLIII